MVIAFSGVDIKTGETICSKSMIKDEWGNVHLLDEINGAFNWDMAHSIFPDSLELHMGKDSVQIVE